MTIKILACADTRALAGGLVIGAAVGFALGGAYLAGGMAQAATAHARVMRLTGAAAQGFSEDALRAQAGAVAPGALAVARRMDPFTATGDPRRERAAVLVASKLEQSHAATPSAAAVDGRGLMLRASYAGPASPAAEPFRAASVVQSARDLDCLADAVYYEARGESATGQAAVAQVVLNRVRHPAFPKSVCGVVFQGAHTGDTCQFSFACDGSMSRPREPGAWRQARSVAARALSGFVMPSVGNATHFHVAGLQTEWGPQLMRVAQIGLHVFYRFGGHAGAPDSFTAKAHPSAPGSDMAARPVYASMLPVGGETADGRQSGQLTLASAVISGPTPAPTPASQAKPTTTSPAATPSVQPAKAEAASAKAGPTS